MGNYIIITAEAAKRDRTGVLRGGTPIMIHGSMQQYITQIARKRRRRVRRVTLGRQNSNMNIRILTTYAPHNGHTEEDAKHQWGEVREIAHKTFKRKTIIWRTDANGQFGRAEEGKTPPNPTPYAIL